MKKNDFISTIGYDGGAAVVDKIRRIKHAQKTLMQLLETSAFRSAAALAIYNNAQDELQTVADYYNNLAHTHYKPEDLPRLFGIAKTESKKIISL